MKNQTVHVFLCPNCDILKIEPVAVSVTCCLMCDMVLTEFTESGLVQVIADGV